MAMVNNCRTRFVTNQQQQILNEIYTFILNSIAGSIQIIVRNYFHGVLDF